MTKRKARTPLERRVAELEAENEELRDKLDAIYNVVSDDDADDEDDED